MYCIIFAVATTETRSIMKILVTRLSPQEWCKLEAERGDGPIYRAFSDKFEWDPSLRVSFTGQPSRLRTGTKRARIRQELIREGAIVADINAAAKADREKYGSAEHDADITLAVFEGHVVLIPGS